MLKVLENKTSKNRSLKGVLFYFRQLQQGFAIIWVIGFIMAFATVGSAIVASYHVSLYDQLNVSLSSQGENLAESGYRFFYSEYKNQLDDNNNQTNDDDKNELIDELHGKTFNISPDGVGGQFELNMTSYFYRIETVTSGTQLKAKFLGDPGFTVPTTGYLRNIEDETLYGYDSYSSAADVYTFNLTGGQTVPSTALYTTVLPAADITAIVDNGDETLTLTLGSNQGTLFPPENGMFLIAKEQVKANLPVMQIVPYKYEYRSGDQLFNVEKGPDLGVLINPTTSDKAEVAKFVSLNSTGYSPDKTNPVAEEINNYQVSLDISASSSWHGSTDLKSYWSGDDSGNPGKDDYRTYDGTLSGSGVTHTETGKVGGALEFDGTGYVSTEFNPRTEIGNNKPFTVVFWAKPTNILATGLVVGAWDLTPAWQLFFIGVHQNKWVWGYGSQAHTVDPPALPDAVVDQWQHIAWVYDGTDIIIYINGIEAYSQVYTGDGLLPDQFLDLGALRDEADLHQYGFQGTLDEVAIFNTALSSCEIREIYDVPCNIGCGTFNTVNDPGVDPVAYYPFNCDENDDNQSNCSAGVAVDESGTDKDGNPPDDNDGAVNNAVLATDRFGCEDKAYDFDGSSDYIEVPHSDSLELSDVNKVTVAAWVKKDSAPDGKRAIVQKSDQSYILRFDDNWPAFIID
ncbi:LamG-like jellyroll fold domain-containing protein, partial [Thermodesulfobacteriota bacterium]